MTADSIVKAACTRAQWCNPDVLEAILQLARDIAVEGYEGEPVGTLFTLGDPEAVLRCSRPLILNPLRGHVPGCTHISDPRLRGTVKELARLDGAFIVAGDGTVVAACQYLDTPSAGIDLPLGLGSRHVAAAAISKHLNVIAIAVSESGVIRIFYDGQMLAEVRQRSFG